MPATFRPVHDAGCRCKMHILERDAFARKFSQQADVVNCGVAGVEYRPDCRVAVQVAVRDAALGRAP